MMDIEELLKDITQKEPVDSPARLVNPDTELDNAITQQFAPDTEVRDYSLILRNALRDIHLGYDDEYAREYGVNLYPLDEGFVQAKEYLNQRNYDKAILIVKACIEEFAAWRENVREGIVAHLGSHYQREPFEILRAIAERAGVNKRKLYDYCATEMAKEKYYGTEMRARFHALLSVLAIAAKQSDFITLQDALFNTLEDKASDEAEEILRKKLIFYQKLHQYKKARQVVLNNIQIESFRKQLVEELIAGKNYPEAKKLILNFFANIAPQENRARPWSQDWDELLLRIAQKEKDIPAIRELSFTFIEHDFHEKYFVLYKSMFDATEWETELERLIVNYQNAATGFSEALADIYAAEQLTDRLLTYIEKYPSIVNLDRYYQIFVAEFPSRTLHLFRVTIDDYTEQHMGERYYGQVAEWLVRMSKIPGGKALAMKMVARYKVRYTKRKVMFKILQKYGF
jgi:hypothetical protein